MDIKTQLLQAYSKENSQKVAAYIGNNSKRYRVLWNLVISEDPDVVKRAAWTLDHCDISYNDKVLPFLPEMMTELEKTKVGSIKRTVLKIFSNVDNIPEDYSARLFDLCMDWIINKKTEIAPKVHAMEVAANIAMPYKELREEVILVIEDQMKHGSAGVKSRGRRLLKRLKIED